MSALQAHTEDGARMVALAERFAVEFAGGAIEHDRTATFAHEHLDKLRANGFLVAGVPCELGGGGVDLAHDLVVAASRLARGDAATAIGVNMHLSVLFNIVRQWRTFLTIGDPRRGDPVAALLRYVVEADVVFSTAVSEPSPQDLTRPTTTAVRTSDGWRIDGRKVFATMSPAATIINTAVTLVDDDGIERYGFALVPRQAEGVVHHDDWDALGMRASASGSVSFDGVVVDAASVRGSLPAGEQSVGLYDRFLVSGAFHAASSLGIAESAHDRIVAQLRRRADGAAQEAHTVMLLAENVVDIAAMRALLGRTGDAIDAYFRRFPTGLATIEDAQAITAEVQTAKTFINAAGGRVTDRALALSGGAGYMAANPLSKAWRDARAGAFMHPLGANRSFDLLARTELGLVSR
jgi:alkylation response protein AidB-like acyl-CoA dehydrogenase